MLWRLMLQVVYWASVLMLLTCVGILFSGWCTRKGEMTKAFELKYISTQMGDCLDEAPMVTYGVVIGSAKALNPLYPLSTLLSHTALRRKHARIEDDLFLSKLRFC